MGAGASAASGPQDKSFLETMMEFTREAEAAIGQGSAPELVAKLIARRSELVAQLRGEVAAEERAKVVTMITLLQEQVYTAKGLPENWAGEVKYTQTEDGGFVATCGEHAIRLGSSFPAGQQRLVVTPLTRTCRQRIFEAAATGKIAFFHGPPGTGKTETMKDTLRDLGWDVQVFNCKDTTTVEEVREVLAQGTPTVFDEFNRCPDALQTMLAIEFAKGAPAIGITANLATGQGIVSEILDRCVSQEMRVPDFALIAEIFLFCEGFMEAEVVGSKLVCLLQDCKDKLSKESHYDFGLRKIKQLKRECGVNGRANAFQDENRIVASTVLDGIWDFLTMPDRGIFKSLVMEHFGIEDLFPTEALEGDRWVRAASALGRVSRLRHGVMCVNVAQSDEQACLGATARAAEAAGATVVHMAGTMEGSVDDFIGRSETGAWLDGAFTKALREANAQGAWLVVSCGPPSGDAQATNFEPLNTLLDDNKVLQLVTGERIPLLPTTRVVFLCRDCASLAPATVSRLGMVWVAPPSPRYF